MKIKHIHIESYKVFKNFDLDFCHSGNIQNLIVLTGKNGNGKTTLLRDVITTTKYDESLKGSYIVCDKEGEKKRYDFFSKSEMLYSTECKPFIRYSPANTFLSNPLQSLIVGYVDKYVYEDGKTSFEAYNQIRAIIDDVFFELDLQIHFKGLDAKRNLLFENEKGEVFGWESLSGGEAQLLSRFFPLFADDITNCLILIDEPEDSFHPLWQSQIVPILRRCIDKNNCQIIIATHSPQIISSAKKDEIRVFVRDENNYVQTKTCMEGPYGWPIQKVLYEIQGAEYIRTPEVEKELSVLQDMVENGKYNTDEFRYKLSSLEDAIGIADADLALIRMEVIRKRKKDEAIK